MSTSRTRTRSSLVPTIRAGYAHKSKAADPWPAPYRYSSQAYDGTTETISDEPHPGYRRLRNRGCLVLGDVELSRTVREHTDANCTYGPFGKPEPENWGYEWLTGDVAQFVDDRVVDPTIISAADISSLRSQVYAKALAKAKDPTVLSGEILGTLGQTISMVRRPFGRGQDLLKRMLTEARKRSKKTTRSENQAIASAWLEYRYGWKPIMSDAFSIASAASEISGGFHVRQLVARASVSINRSWSDTQRVSGGIPRVNYVDVRGSYQNTGSVSAGVIYQVRSRTRSEQLMAILGLRLEDIPSTVWELTPFSFVADWFGNFGTWIRAITPSIDVKVNGGWTTVAQTHIKSLTHNGTLYLESLPTFPRVTWTNLNCGSSKKTTFTLSRSCTPAIPNPVLSFTPLTVQRQADSAALIHGQFMSNLGRMNHARR